MLTVPYFDVFEKAPELFFINFLSSARKIFLDFENNFIYNRGYRRKRSEFVCSFSENRKEIYDGNP